MLNLKRFVPAALILTALFTTAVAAPNVAGNWSGKIVFDLSKMPQPKTPEDQKKMKEQLGKIAKVRIALKLNSNKTFTVKMPAMGNQPAQNAEGTWKQSGRTVTLKTTKENGKPATGESAKPQDLTLDGSGKTLTMLPPGGAQIGFKIVFVKA